MKKALFIILILLALTAGIFSLSFPIIKNADADIYTIEIIFNGNDYVSVAKNPDTTEKISITDNGNGTFQARIEIIARCPVFKFSVNDKDGNHYKDVSRGTSEASGEQFTISFVIDQAMLQNSVFYEGEYLIQLFPDGTDSNVYSAQIENLTISDFDINVKVSYGGLITDLGQNLNLRLFKDEVVTVTAIKRGTKNIYSLRGGPSEVFFNNEGKATFTMVANDLSLEAVYGNYLSLTPDDLGHLDTEKSGFSIKNTSSIAYSGESVMLTVYPLMTLEHKGFVVSSLIKMTNSSTVNIFEFETGSASFFERKGDGSVTYTFTMGDEDVEIKPVFEKIAYEITFGDTISGEGILDAYDIEIVNNDYTPKPVFKLSEAIAGKTFSAYFGDSLTYKIYVKDSIKYYIENTEMCANLKRSLYYLYQSDEDGIYNHDAGVSVIMTQGNAEITVGNLLNIKYRVTLNELAGKANTAYLLKTGESENYVSSDYPWDQAKPIYLKPAPGYKFLSAPYFIKDNDENRQKNYFTTSVYGWYFYLESNPVTVHFTTEKVALTASILSAGGSEDCISWLEVTRYNETVKSTDGKLTCYVGETVTIKTAPAENYEFISVSASSVSLVENTFIVKGSNVSITVNYALHKAVSLAPTISLEGINTTEKVYNTVGLTSEILTNYIDGYDFKFKIESGSLPVNIDTLKESFTNGVYNFAGKRIAVKDLSVYAVDIGLDLIHFTSGDTACGVMAKDKKLSVYLPIISDSSVKDFTYVARYNKQNGEMTILTTNRRSVNGQVYYDFNINEFTKYLIISCNYDLENSANLVGSIEADGVTDPMFNRVIYGGEFIGNEDNTDNKKELEWYWILIICLGSAGVVTAVILVLIKAKILPFKVKKNSKAKHKKRNS